MIEIVIRQATIIDIKELSDLFDWYRIFYGKPSDTQGAKHFLSERLNKKDAIAYIAIDPDADQYVGFTLLYPLFSSTRMKRMWLLNDLYVIEKYRGHGISKMLIDEAKKLAISTNACGIQLETAKTNIIGNQLYPATGFELENDVNFYFWTNSNI